MTSFSQHKDPSIFVNPEKFDSERWLNNKTFAKYLVPFSKGTRQCLGINLATAEIYLTLATFFRRFEMQLYETTERNVAIVHDFFVPGTHTDSTGVITDYLYIANTLDIFRSSQQSKHVGFG